jgi:hypothetical protein
MLGKKTYKASTAVSIPIQTNKNPYILQQNLCDPFTNSPPNEFMKKLYMRVEHYNGGTLGVQSNKRNKE